MPGTIQEKIILAAEIINHSRHLVIFTGAGISTPSGIPDFRSQKNGLWQKDNPMEVASATAFRYHPEKFYNWLRPLLQAAHNARPNPAHLALAEMEKKGIVRSVITQNIDGLHQKAGSKNVIELHGSMIEYACPKCRALKENPSEVIDEILTGAIPHCKRCGSIVKPGITLFEEMLPEQAWEQAELEVAQADVMLVAGSSLEVTPASSLPYTACRRGCKVIIVNLSPTYLDQLAALTLQVDVTVGVPGILSALKSIRNHQD